ncbi:class I SAM-dependent methyltransferase [Clostridium boliviensis]|uniref:Class I SAM-dependent methyltransferase n=1 Tax=Clostridium boliviensis TaxID=318465 RepID=A0ABU4GUL7_9CLOT|nr:class I SAM-dependent methyltransferase [Clostridium boliviensis]MDW2800638.1 class I SAM-dependent methyltransferase [Clostridium boliviensis]
MEDYCQQNKRAWEYNAYDFWINNSGEPKDRAKKDLEDPIGMLKRYANYFETYRDIKVANIFGSCGKKVIPLAILGSEVTIFDISEDNKKYALEVADAANVKIDFVVGDVLEIDMNKYEKFFDVVLMEGGILHYFHEIDQFMRVMCQLLKPNGRLICSDFHPFQKISDMLEIEQPTMSYFSTDVFEGEMAHARFFSDDIRKQMPLCSYRKYTISEIINAVIFNGFSLTQFDEHPAWKNENVPGEFTLVARKT